jgi:hypothetical protein
MYVEYLSGWMTLIDRCCGTASENGNFKYHSFDTIILFVTEDLALPRV